MPRQKRQHPTRAENARRLCLAREERIRRMWERFVRLMQEEGLEPKEGWRVSGGSDHRLLIMQAWRRKGLPARWTFQNPLEAADLGAEEEVPLEEPMPTDAMPGTLEKVRVLAERADHGKELWHDQDRRDCDGIGNGAS